MPKKTPVINETQQALSEAAREDQFYAVSAYLKKLKFAPRLMGVDQMDVWRKLEKLCELYDDAFTAERMRSAQLQEEKDALQKQYDELMVKARQIMAAYQKLKGEQANGEN